jgi:predicted nucleic acid-binding protein
MTVFLDSTVLVAAMVEDEEHHESCARALESAEDYIKLLDNAGPVGARGGAICDLLLLACARKVKARKIYTLNHRHFCALAPDLADKIVSP